MNLNCPFCDKRLGCDAEVHVLACSLAEIFKQGPKLELAIRCELAARPDGIYEIKF